VYTIDRTDVRINGIKSKIGGTEMNNRRYGNELKLRSSGAEKDWIK